jgi:quercetin dioxygenase-like cupin family protein
MKSPRLLAVAAVLLLGLLTLSTALGTSAHDMAAMQATPADPLAGVTVEAMGTVQPASAPGQTLQMLQLTLEPGTTIAMHHHPGPVIISVASGQFTTSFAESSAMLTRAGATEAEAVESGEDYVMDPGDTVAYDANTTGHVMKNAGTDPLVLIAAVLFEDGQPGFIFEEGTPTS